jgi:cell division protein FtsI/penicillin-binding protein 2
LGYLKNFKIDSKTGIDIPEVAGDISVLSKMRDVNFATASFGQGIALTPIELLRAFTAVINGGKLVMPHLVDKIISKNGDTANVSISSPSQVISPETSKKLVDMLIKVVENGSGQSASVAGYTIAGKTGTAQIPDLKNGGYLIENIHTFIGFAPAHDPKFIALIKLDKPKEVRFAESTVVPVFSDLAKFIFSYLQIPPDKPVAENK